MQASTKSLLLSLYHHKDSHCADLGLIYPNKHSCDLWGHSITDQTGTEIKRRQRYYKDITKTVKNTTHHHMNSVLLGEGGLKTKISECISKENKERIKKQVKPRQLGKHQWHLVTCSSNRNTSEMENNSSTPHVKC